VTCDRSVVFFTNKTDRHDIIDIVLQVVLSTIAPVNTYYVLLILTKSYYVTLGKVISFLFIECTC